jgi:hypothetical protein
MYIMCGFCVYAFRDQRLVRLYRWTLSCWCRFFIRGPFPNDPELLGNIFQKVETSGSATPVARKGYQVPVVTHARHLLPGLLTAPQLHAHTQTRDIFHHPRPGWEKRRV